MLSKPLVLYNSLSGKKEEFKPLKKNHLGIYVCGPTVYSYVDLGNCRTFISFDIIYRYFMHKGYKVRYVRNLTDVGHLENYYSTKQFVLKTRYFNTLQFDDQGESVVKTSTNNEKLIDEINWYKSVPKDLQDLIPKVLYSSTKDNPFVKLEYIKNPTLSELWLYSEFLTDFWKAVITDLFAIIQRFKN